MGFDVFLQVRSCITSSTFCLLTLSPLVRALPPRFCLYPEISVVFQCNIYPPARYTRPPIVRSGETIGGGMKRLRCLRSWCLSSIATPIFRLVLVLHHSLIATFFPVSRFRFASRFSAGEFPRAPSALHIIESKMIAGTRAR
jgi:hypothetical protein